MEKSNGTSTRLTPQSIGRAIDLTGVSRMTWWLVVVAGFGVFFDVFDNSIISLCLPFLQKEFGLNVQSVGYIGSAGMLGMALGSYLSGWFSDHWGRISVFAIMVAIFSIFTGLTALCATVGLVILARIIAGFGLGGLIPLATLSVAEAVPTRSRGAMIGWVGLAGGVGAVLASVLGKALIANVGWRLMFVVGTLPILLAIAAKIWIPESPRWLSMKGRDADAAKSLVRFGVTPATMAKATEESSNDPAAANQTKPRIRDLFAPGMGTRVAYNWIVTILAQFVMVGFNMFAMVIFINNYHMQASFALTFMVYFSVSQLVGRLVAVPILDRIGRRNTLILGCIGACIAPVLILMNSSVPFLLVSTVLIGFCSAPMVNAITAMSTELYPMHIRGLGTSAAMGAGRLAGAAAPAVFGWILTGGSANWIWIVMSALSLVAAVLTMIMGIETGSRTLEEAGETKAKSTASAAS